MMKELRYSLKKDGELQWMADTLEEVDAHARILVRKVKPLTLDDFYTCIERWNGYDKWEEVKGTRQKIAE